MSALISIPMAIVCIAMADQNHNGSIGWWICLSCAAICGLCALAAIVLEWLDP